MSLNIEQLYRKLAEPIAGVVAAQPDAVPTPVVVEPQAAAAAADLAANKIKAIKGIGSALDANSAYDSKDLGDWGATPEGKAWITDQTNTAFGNKLYPQAPSGLGVDGKPLDLGATNYADQQAWAEHLSRDNSPYSKTKFTLPDEKYKGLSFTPGEYVGGPHIDRVTAAKLDSTEWGNAVTAARTNAAGLGREAGSLAGAGINAITSGAEATKVVAAQKQMQDLVQQAHEKNPTGMVDWLTSNWKTLLVPGGLLLAAFGGNAATTMLGLAAAGYGGYDLYNRYQYMHSPQGQEIMKLALDDASKGIKPTPERLAGIKAKHGDEGVANYHDWLGAVNVGFAKNVMQDEVKTKGDSIHKTLNPWQASADKLLAEQKRVGVLSNADRRAAQDAAAAKVAK